MVNGGGLAAAITRTRWWWPSIEDQREGGGRGLPVPPGAVLDLHRHWIGAGWHPSGVRTARDQSARAQLEAPRKGRRLLPPVGHGPPRCGQLVAVGSTNRSWRQGSGCDPERLHTQLGRGRR